MRVKIGDIWYDSNETPICIYLTDQDKRNIADMLTECSKYAVFPDDKAMSADEMRAWMTSGGDE